MIIKKLILLFKIVYIHINTYINETMNSLIIDDESIIVQPITIIAAIRWLISDFTRMYSKVTT
jgi:hypothetical protein